MNIFKQLLLTFILTFTPAPASAGYLEDIGRNLNFCGEPVPLNQPEVFKAVDQNLILLAEARSRIWLTLRRSSRFLPVIERELAKAKVPNDLKYIPLAITNLAPDYNNVGRGLWRLRESEAKLLGLKVDETIDERLDPVTATVAAARRLSDLKNIYGSWTTAMAAHLISELSVQKSVAEADGEKNYYQLYFSEGQEQLPSTVLASKIIFSDLAAFGYNPNPAQAWPPLTNHRETLETATTIRALATQFGQDYKTFRDMNPHLLSPTVPAGVTINIP
ncbi:MAG: transglycosylase SLT domain-containing protein [Candidatus Adiutrix intracellularis]|nr:transglycosylase SLT domain-containing protein [Candidatus Adiutrix intracellularis]